MALRLGGIYHIEKPLVRSRDGPKDLEERSTGPRSRKRSYYRSETGIGAISLSITNLRHKCKATKSTSTPLDRPTHSK